MGVGLLGLGGGSLRLGGGWGEGAEILANSELVLRGRT